MIIGMSVSPSWTRVAFLAQGQNRADAENRATLARPAVSIGEFPRPRPGPRDQAAARAKAGSVLDTQLRAMTRPGVSMVAVDRHGEVAGALTLHGKAGTINAGVIGRHGRCDLYLASDESLSLRHATVVVDEHGGFRLLDLRTGSGLRDVAGRRHDGIASAEEAVVCLGDHLLVARARRPEDPAGPMRSPWAPPLAVGTGIVDSSVRIARTAPGDENLSMTFTGGLTRTGGGLVAGAEARQGMIELAADGAREVWPVGERALGNGILLGRYERCDGHGSRILARRGISRVHALIIAADGIPHVLDLGSTNGTWIDGAEVRVARLTSGTTFRLGERGPSITWRGAN